MLRISITFMAARGAAQAHCWQSSPGKEQTMGDSGVPGPVGSGGIYEAARYGSTHVCAHLLILYMSIYYTHVRVPMCVSVCLQLLEDQETAWGGKEVLEGYLRNGRSHPIPCENRGGTRPTMCALGW